MMRDKDFKFISALFDLCEATGIDFSIDWQSHAWRTYLSCSGLEITIHGKDISLPRSIIDAVHKLFFSMAARFPKEKVLDFFAPCPEETLETLHIDNLLDIFCTTDEE